MSRLDHTQTQYDPREPPIAHPKMLAWERSGWKRFPWQASCAFVAVLILLAATAVVLYTSDNQEVSAWPSKDRTVPVSVLLAILVNLANLCLAMALSQAYTVSWWKEALKGAQLSRLQFNLSVQHGFSALLRPSRSFNRFLLAALVAIIVSIADGPILQRASTTGLLTLTATDESVKVFVSPEPLPGNFSAWSGFSDQISLLTPVFGNVSKEYASHDDIMLPYSGCQGNSTCKATMTGPGFDTICNDSSVAYDYKDLSAAISSNNNITAFQIDFLFGDSDNSPSIPRYSMMNFTLRYKPDADCIGNFVTRFCSMRLATVEYPITISNGTAVLQPWRSSQNETIELIKPYTVVQDGVSSIIPPLWVPGQSFRGLQSMLGGIVYVSRSLYESYANLRLPAKESFLVNVTGQAASNYLTSNISQYGDCTMTWGDPTVDIINTARELMFRSAIANSLANSSYSTPQDIPAISTRVITAYRTRFEYFGISVALMVLEGIVILFLLRGWHNLGRDASLDAFEISHALGAPLLQEANSNATVDGILEASGHKHIRYGEVIRGEPHGEQGAAAATMSSQGGFVRDDNSIGLLGTGYDGASHTGEHGWERNEKEQFTGSVSSVARTPRLGFAEAENVRPVTPGKQYY